MKVLTGYVKAALAAAQAAWKREPVRVTSIAVSIVVFACAKAGVVIPEVDIVKDVALTLPILLGGQLARAKVTPNTGA
jgi:hypothetical protein